MKKACVLLLIAAPGAAESATAGVGSNLILHHVRHRRHQHHKAATAQTSAVAQQTEDPPVDLSKLPPIPPAASTGPDGFPHLPAVNKMLDDADQTMKSINEQASALEKRVVQAQMEKAAKMERQKAVFEQKLHTQEDQNRAMLATNDAISKEIATLKAGNAAITKHAKELQVDNALIRSELNALETSLASAGSYAADTLAQTDDSGAEVLAVLDPQAAAVVPATPPATASASSESYKKHQRLHDHDKMYLTEVAGRQSARSDDLEEADAVADDADDAQEDDDYDAEDDATSFLATRTARLRATAKRQDPAKADEGSQGSPRDIVNVLQQRLESLQTQERDSEAKLKDLFIAEFQAGSKRHAALNVHQKALNWTRSGLLSTQAKLKAAEAHLTDTKTRLQERVRGLGLFVQRLAHLALAPPAEVPHLLQALPTNITAAPAPETQASTPESATPAAPAAPVTAPAPAVTH